MCNCIEEVNKTLEPHNTRLSLAMCITPSTGILSTALEVPTEKINPRGKKMRLMPIYCPFCGVKL